MVIDPRELGARFRRRLTQERAPAGAICVHCGRELGGLAVQATCPACGEGISEQSRAVWAEAAKASAAGSSGLQRRELDDYKKLPRASKQRLATGLSMAAVGLVLMLGGMLVVWVAMNWMFMQAFQGIEGAYGPPMTLSTWSLVLLTLPGAVLWVVGLGTVCPRVPPPPRDPADAEATAARLDGLSVGRRWWWPYAVTGSAALWIGVFGSLVGITLAVPIGWTESMEEALSFLAAVLAGCAAIGNSIVCWHLRDIARIFRDDDAMIRMEQSAVLIPPVMLLLVLFVFNPFILGAGVFSPVGLLLGAFALFGCAAWPIWRFLAGVWMLGSTARWGVRDDVEQEHRVRRLIEASRAIEGEPAAHRGEATPPDR
jgi:hypothetical protein